MSVKVEDRGNGRYRVRVYAGPDPMTGHPRQYSKSFKAASAKELKTKASAAESALRAQLGQERVDAGTVAEAVREWRRHKQARAAATTRQRTDAITDRIIADLGRFRLDRLTARDVDRFYTKLREENISQTDTPRYRSESTIHHYHRVLRSILRQSKKWGKVTGIVTEDATVSGAQRRRVNAPRTETVLALVASAKPELRFAAALAARTGLRRGELMGLRWSDVQGNTLEVKRALVQTTDGLAYKDTKAGDEREVELGADTLTAIASHRAYMDQVAASAKVTLDNDSPMFPDIKEAKGRRSVPPRRPHWLTQAWRDHAAGTGIRFHDLRHWHITMLIDQGIPVSSVAGRAGHKQTSTTVNVYSHAVRETDVRSATIIDQLLAPTPPGLPAPQ